MTERERESERASASARELERRKGVMGRQTKRQNEGEGERAGE